MLARMKTTIDIADDLFEQAKEAARKRKTTLRALVEEGLRTALARKDPIPPYELPDLRTGKRGGGFMPGIDHRNWSQIRAIIYEGRGG